MKIFIERPIATAMAFLALTVLGVYSFFNIPIEMPPTQEQFPELVIETDWRGMPPDIVQTQLTSPIEEKQRESETPKFPQLLWNSRQS